MNEFVKNIVSSMNVDEDTAKSATGALLKAARENLSSEDYSKLAENVENVDGLIAQSPQEKKPEQGIKEAAQGLLGRATEALGGESGGSIGLGALLAAAGLKPDQMPDFVQKFLDYIQEKVGSDITGNMLSKMSGLLDLKSGDV